MMKWISLCSSVPVQLLLVVILCASCGHLLPLSVKEISYSISLTIKEGLLVFLPFMIFSFIFASFSEFRQGAFSFVLVLLAAVCLSNFVVVMVAYGAGQIVLPWLPQGILSHGPHGFDLQHGGSLSLTPLWHPALPRLLSNDKALLVGVILGIIAARQRSDRLRQWAVRCKGVTIAVLERGFLPIVPIFICGFMLKLAHDGVLVTLLCNFSSLLMLVLVLQLLYTTLIYGLATGFRPGPWCAAMQKAAPAWVLGFSSMSSAAALPALMRNAESDPNPEIARTVAPAVINIHMLGDGLGIPLMALLILYHTSSALPDLTHYLGFAFGYVLAKFAAAGVPGGTILVMIPVLEAHLGFHGEMSALILMIYMLFDPFCTAFNVFGNGGFVLLFTRGWTALERRLRPAISTKIA